MGTFDQYWNVVSIISLGIIEISPKYTNCQNRCCDMTIQTHFANVKRISFVQPLWLRSVKWNLRKGWLISPRSKTEDGLLPAWSLSDVFLRPAGISSQALVTTLSHRFLAPIGIPPVKVPHIGMKFYVRFETQAYRGEGSRSNLNPFKEQRLQVFRNQIQ